MKNTNQWYLQCVDASFNVHKHYFVGIVRVEDQDLDPALYRVVTAHGRIGRFPLSKRVKEVRSHPEAVRQAMLIVRRKTEKGYVVTPYNATAVARDNCPVPDWWELSLSVESQEVLMIRHNADWNF